MDKTGDVLSHICAVMSSLSPSEKAIATYVLDHPSDVATMTVRELAAETGTSPASVSRFARTLDYRTYSDMRLALGISISRASGEEKATDGRITLDDVEAPSSTSCLTRSRSSPKPPRSLTPMTFRQSSICSTTPTSS